MKKNILNDAIESIAPSVTLGIASLAKQKKAAGQTVYSFAAGEPDFDTPDAIKSAAVKALDSGKTKYTPATGLPALCEAIADKLGAENGLTYDPKQIIVSNGAKHSLFNTIMTLCRPGDEVIVPSPYWLSYPEMIRVAGGKTVVLEGREEQGFKISAAQLEEAVTPRTKMLILNSPSNPSGVVYTETELRAIAEVAVRHGFFIVSDEIYEKLLYDDTVHFSIGSISQAVYDLTVTINGFSKAFSMTGWRLGYLAAPQYITKAIGAFQSHSTSAPNTFAQHGAIEALRTGGPDVVRMGKAFAERRTYMYERLTAIPGVTCVKPMGAFYMMPNISVSGMGSVQFAERLLEEAGVAVVPGLAFGTDHHVRLSYACDMEQIRDGLDRVEQFIAAG